MITLEWLALIAVLITTGGIFLRRRWQWNIGFLAVQYLAVFWLVNTEWTLAMSTAKLVTGWMACAILGIAHISSLEDQVILSSWIQGRLFRLAAIGMVIVISYTGSTSLSSWLGLSIPAAWGALLLIGMGLFNLGVSTQPFRVIIGLLTALSGFEIFHAAVENSTMVAGLLVVINLGLSLAGAYFLSLSREEQVI